MRTVSITFGAVVGALTALLALAPAARAADPYIRDRPEDTGSEPSPSSMPTTSSPDIWVRRSPDPNYNPAPFTAASPPWTPQPHQNAQHFDPALGAPNWVYVRVTNRGTGATPASARLKLYWTKIGSNQNWPTTWVDYFATVNGQSLLNGMEITKPRRNAASVTQAERDAYVQAILAADTADFAFPDGVTFWDKQNDIHSAGPVQSAAHGNPAFLPWHREFMNRYEVLLQKTNPTLKLLYWDWTRDPRQPINGFSYFSTDFMGAIGAGTTTEVREPFVPLMSPIQLVRNSRTADQTFGFRSDPNVLARAQYHNLTGNNGLRTFIETGSYHNRAHVDVGGSQPTTCPQQPETCLYALSYVVQAARDPFFFLLHGNVDRLWAQWQRANPLRFDSRPGATPYGLDSSNANITRTMPPWDGSAEIEPWTSGSPAVRNKTSLDPSVVSPPIYDTAPLAIPVLQAGQAVVMQIPWYPPDPVPFGSQGFSLLARIETSTTPPYGMRTAEGATVATNIRNNNNIARLNITVLPATAGTGAPEAATARLSNEFSTAQAVTLQAAAGEAAVEVTLPDTLMTQWKAAGAPGEDVTVVGGNKVEIAPGGKIEGLALAPGQSVEVPARTQGGAAAKLAQLGLPGDPGGLATQTQIEPTGRSAAPALGRGEGLILPQFLHAGERVDLPANSVGDPRRFVTATLFVDGRAVETRRRPPFDFAWSGEQAGQYELRIEATDKVGTVASVSRVVTIAANLPPESTLTAPEEGAHFRVGAAIRAEATASDPEGKIARVDFYATPMTTFADPVLVGSDSSAPYATTIRNLGPGMWMVYAVAVDGAGVQAQSISSHIMVMPKEGMAHP
jgi:hypothetical protein